MNHLLIDPDKTTNNEVKRYLIDLLNERVAKMPKDEYSKISNVIPFLFDQIQYAPVTLLNKEMDRVIHPFLLPIVPKCIKFDLIYPPRQL